MMSTEKRCGCKGIRLCLLCENLKPAECINTESSSNLKKFYYCPLCTNKAWVNKDHLTHCSNNVSTVSINIEGVFIATNVIDAETEQSLVENIERTPWVDSQSGRKKQDYGPKVNFKKHKCKIGNFKGLPLFAQTVFKDLKVRFQDVLFGFEPVELCNLEYTPERGSAIDPHIDDCWLWGERLVTLNLLSSTVLTLNPTNDSSSVEIAIEMPARSFVMLFGEARYNWNHSIKRSDVKSRRIAMTWRELTPRFLPAGEDYDTIGKELLETASMLI